MDYCSSSGGFTSDYNKRKTGTGFEQKSKIGIHYVLKRKKKNIRKEMGGGRCSVQKVITYEGEKSESQIKITYMNYTNMLPKYDWITKMYVTMEDILWKELRNGTQHN